MALLVIFCNVPLFAIITKFHDIAQYSNSHICSMENDKNKI